VVEAEAELHAAQQAVADVLAIIRKRVRRDARTEQARNALADLDNLTASLSDEMEN
jgi:hypothetical protein